MDLDDLAQWCGARGEQLTLLETRVGELPAHRLVWNYHSEARGGGAANVEAGGSRPLPGLLLQTNGKGLALLDRKEGHPRRYRRELASVVSQGEAIEAWVYRVLPEFIQSRVVLPTPTYVQILLRAAQRWELPEWHREELRALL